MPDAERAHQIVDVAAGKRRQLLACAAACQPCGVTERGSHVVPFDTASNVAQLVFGSLSSIVRYTAR